MEQVLQNETDFAAYHVEALLGRGGMSEVYRASNPRLENTIALKLLARELTEDQTFRERFIRESRLAASLNHPNVVPIFDAGEWEGVPYIAMRFVDGPDLKQLLESRGPFAPDYAISIVGQVAAALDCAHAKGLVHRDVKPGNILIDESVGDGSVPHVYLADFGVAKHRQSHSGLTSKGHYVGTIDYVAPEQIEGRTLSAATDVYSLGCVLFECLTGSPPFDHDSDVAMIFAHLSEAPPAPSARRPELPAALDAVILKALAKNPEERYASCRELVAAARAALEAGTSETAFAVPVGQATIPATPPALETVLAGSGNGADPAPIPPTELATPATEHATMSAQPAEDAASSEPYTLRNRPAWRSRRRLVIGFVALLLAAGTAVAAPQLIGSSSSGKKTPASKTPSSGQSGSALSPGEQSKKKRGGGGTSKTSSGSTSKTLKQRRSSASSSSSGSTSKTLKKRRSSGSSSSSSGSTSSSLKTRRSSGSSSSNSGSTSSSLKKRRSSGSSSSSSGSTSSTLKNRRKK